MRTRRKGINISGGGPDNIIHFRMYNSADDSDTGIYVSIANNATLMDLFIGYRDSIPEGWKYHDFYISKTLLDGWNIYSYNHLGIRSMAYQSARFRLSKTGNEVVSLYTDRYARGEPNDYNGETLKYGIIEELTARAQAAAAPRAQAAAAPRAQAAAAPRAQAAPPPPPPARRPAATQHVEAGWGTRDASSINGDGRPIAINLGVIALGGGLKNKTRRNKKIRKLIK